MEALVWLGGDRLDVEEAPQPVPDETETLFHVSLAGICGSDLHAFRGHGGKRVPPLILGHEAVGTIDADERLYVVFPLEGCGHCVQCRRGQENLCADRRLLGLDRPGTFAAEVSVPRGALVPVPEGVTPEVAALTEPLATSLASLKGVDLSSATTVAVIGCGSIGLLAVYAAAAAGVGVVATDPLADRREVALQLGATRVVESADDLEAASVDVVIDAVGLESTWSAALRAVSAGGTVVVVGLGQYSGALEVGDLVRRGVTVRGSYAYTREDFAEALALLARRPLTTAWLERQPLSEGRDAFASLADQSANAVKILLVPDGRGKD